VVAAAEVAALVRELPAHDAYLVACFGDPGVGAARELTEAPVVGIGEAAFQAAVTIARRFAVITTLKRSIPELEDMLDRHGVRSRCVAVEPLDIPVADQGSHNPDTTAAIVAAGRRVVSGAGAEALVLACGGMADVAAAVRRDVGVPVCDGVAFGAMMAFSLWRCGLSTSKAGAYGWPEPIAYADMPAFRD
jgi:allantoin racemase